MNYLAQHFWNYETNGRVMGRKIPVVWDSNPAAATIHMKIAFHGTSRKKALSIIQNGYVAETTNFEQSNKNYCYLIKEGEDITQIVTQAFLQGGSACIREWSELDPCVLAFDIANLPCEKDTDFGDKLDAVKVEASKICIKTHLKGIFCLDRKLHDFYKFTWLKKATETCTLYTPQLSAEEKEVIDSIASMQLTPIIKRDVICLKNETNYDFSKLTITF